MMWTRILSLVHGSHHCSSYLLNRFNNGREFQSLVRNIAVTTNKQVPTSLIGKPSFQRFHSSPRHNVPIPPLIWLIMKPVSKVLALITGRSLRKWWRRLPPNKKQYFVEATKRNRWKIAGFVLLSSGITFVYYYSHLQETPYTKRRRFIVFTPEKFKEIADFEYLLQYEENKSSLLPEEHPLCKQVANVVNQIHHANKDIEELQNKTWKILVVDKDIRNAFVLPNGQIFVYTGMLKLCDNDDQLGIILSHEIAHCVLSHGAENLSYSQFLDVAAIILMGALWAIMPSDLIAFVAERFFNKIVEILIHLPYSRKLEVEADEVGLQLAAKACIDVRESSAFWAKVAAIDEIDEVRDVEWLSTHPNNETRVDYLNSIMDKNIELRKNCGCPTLMQNDPRSTVELIRKNIKEMMKQKDAESLKYKD